MFGAVARLFERYADAHYRVDVSGAPIHSPDGSLIGRIEVLRRRWRRIEVEGWCTLPDIRLDPGLGPPIVARRHARPTEVDAVDCVARPGFSCAALAEPGRAALIVGGTDAPLRLPLTDLTPGTRLLGTLRLIPGFAAALLSVSPHLLRWLLHRDPEARAAVGRAFREGGEEEAVWLPDDLLAVEGPGPSALPTAACWPVTIILPVFNAFDLLGNCLQRVEENTDTPWHLIIVHDASTDPLVGPFLRGWAAARPDRVTLLEQQKNLGFVAATNRGLAEAAKHGGHVVLLNSDANVPPRWASRLLAPFDGHPEVASVTPMSNDAELLTVPRMSRRIDLRGGAADRIDAAAQKIAAGVSLAEMPTGVGFCMALAPAWLARVPAFDRSFGRGYGEEVDWCQKTRALGARHLGHAGLFVEHWGGASFGSEKLRHVQDAARVISQRYPRFDTEVQRFLASDPLAAPRLALAVAWAGVAGEGAVPVYLAHSLGGGAELWLQKRVRADVEGPAGAALVIRVGGRARWRVEVHGPWGESAGQSDSGDLIVRLLALAGERHAIYSCGVGDIDPVSLPGWLLRFAGEGATVSVLFHDYLPLSPSYTLLDADGCYRGVPRDDRTDPAHRAPGSDGATVPLSAWRSAWKPLLDAAAFRGEVVTFSEASRAIVAEAFPYHAANLRVRPHPVGTGEKVASSEVRRGRSVLGVLGNLAPHKGAGVTAEISRRLAEMGDPAPDLVLIGNLDPAYRLASRHRCHGTYAPDQIADLIRRYGITHWLIPSIWPETFSFTTREALATGLPVLCFDLGAQADAARAQPNGLVLPLGNTDAENVETVLRALIKSAAASEPPATAMDRGTDSP